MSERKYIVQYTDCEEELLTKIMSMEELARLYSESDFNETRNHVFFEITGQGAFEERKIKRDRERDYLLDDISDEHIAMCYVLVDPDGNEKDISYQENH